MKIKTTILALLIFTVSLAVKAQDFTSTFSLTSQTGTANTIIAFAGNIVNDIGCCPTSVKMEILSTNLPSGWGVSFCTPVGCYPVGTTNNTFVLNPSASGYLGVDFHTSSTNGTGYATIKFTNTNNINDTAVFNFDATVGAVGIADVWGTSNFILTQNYPNPFSEQSVINYDLQNLNIAHFIITDLSGKKVFEQQLNASKGNIIITAADFSKGVYFYMINTPNAISVRKKLVIQ